MNIMKNRVQLALLSSAATGGILFSYCLINHNAPPSAFHKRHSNLVLGIFGITTSLFIGHYFFYNPILYGK